MAEPETPTNETPAEQAAKRGAADPRTADPLPPNDPSRVLAEKTRSALSFQMLLLRRYLEQTFKVNPQLSVTFRSLSSGLVEFIFTQLSKTHGSGWASIFDEALRNYYVAATLQRLGDNPIGADLDEALLAGEARAIEVMTERLQYVRGLPSNLVYLLYAHYVLFSNRVDAFIRGGDQELGNS